MYVKTNLNYKKFLININILSIKIKYILNIINNL
jgi:hypothetical protein